MIFRRKSVKTTEEIANLTGFFMDTPLADYDTQKGKVCLVKALIIFCASLGTVGSIVSAFSLELNMGLVIAALLIFSLVLAFLHYNRILFNLAYPLIFFVFAFSILSYRLYVNSGFQAISNIIREQYRDYFELTYSRQTAESITNRTLTITIALIFLGFFLALMLNIAISNYMSTFLTIFMTFPFLQFGLYIGQIPSPFYLFLLLYAYISVALLKRSEHFMLSENKRKDKPYTKKHGLISYKGNGSIMQELCGVCLVICIALTALTYPVMQSHFLETDEVSKPKEFTDHYIKLFVQNGLFSFFNRYTATGGMNDGRLGGISSVSSDNEPDLTVTFAPTSMNTVYLKGFTGQNYTQDAWLAPDYDEADLQDVLRNRFDAYQQYSSQLETKRLEHFKLLRPDKLLYGKMTVKKLEMLDDHIYVPYYTQNDASLPVTIDHSARGKQSEKTVRYSLNYYPLSQSYLNMTSETYDQLTALRVANDDEIDYINYYDMYQKLHYKTVSETCREAIATASEEIGTAKSEMELVTKVQQYFAQNYRYTLSPGSTPQSEDFISYFMTDQKEGFCVHFASAGTMIMRAYGIPARYVEGYVIKLADMADATVLENEKTEDWLDGTPEINNTGVIKVNIADTNAHAWTEIYIDGFGWYPVDFTPPSMRSEDDEENESIFSALFSGFFSADSSQESSIAERISGISQRTNASRNLFLLVPTVVTILVFILFVFLRRWIAYYGRLRRVRLACMTGDYSAQIAYQYERMLTTLRRKRIAVSDRMLPSDVFKFLGELSPETSELIDATYACLEKALYSKEIMTKEKADQFTSNVKLICKVSKVSKR